jgi:hypothetical protein
MEKPKHLSLPEGGADVRRIASEFCSKQCNFLYKKWCIKRWFDEDIQSVLGGTVNILGGGSTDYSE